VYLPLLLLPDAKSFMETFQEVAESQKPVDDKTASAAAGLVEKLSVEDKTVDAEKKDEEKTEEKESAAAVEASKEDANKKVEEPASSA
jgi:Ran-binding protein 1